jgi:membrane-associated phospholipid phosphatase
MPQGVARADANSTDGSAEADEDYDYRGRRFGWWDYLATGWTLGSFYAIESGLGPPQSAPWKGTIPPFEEPVRSLMRAPTREGREQAGELSDYFWYANIAYPVVVAAVVPPIRGARFDMIWQLEMMNLQAYALVSVFVRIPHKLIGRTRPNDRDCQEDPEYDRQCVDPSAGYVSFPGGHVGVAMTGAGLSCAHHLHGELFGGGWPDAGACILALLSAETVGILRLRADKHWLSDNLVGAAAGFGIGYGLPTLLYYHPFWGDPPARKSTPRGDELYWTVAPQVDGERYGLSLVGAF